MSIIQIQGADFSYTKKRKLLSGIQLEIEPGHIHGLLGKNGEGKSTLLKLMAGLLFPQKGEIEVMGFNPQKRQVPMLQDVYFLAEELPTFRLTIKQFEDVYAPFYPHFSGEQFDRYLTEFDIDSKAFKMNQLSHGQKKKVMISFALAANTRVLLMDEPTNGLDIPSKGQFRRIVASTLDDKRCVIISTHQVRDLDSLIDNIIIMDNHEIVLNESIDGITDRLLFRVQENPQTDETLVHQEDTLRGVYQVCENINHEESKLDIELLFNSVYNNRKRIQQIFNSKK
ncbi:MAG: ABC transporter ATP-binding protein [Dysgonamonadaceae bacterium]|jgi:ABC-2 type transport system ATP-binding protein|nr:ABC transporter ATP-binding protein [Dysgonamonadaceae bacterium]